jgi:ABC-2 type transport system permease protein
MKTGVIFRRALRDARKSILGWGILCAVMGLWIGVFYPAVDDLLASMSALLENPLIKGMVGDVSDFASPAGWVGTKFLIMLPLLMAVYAVLFNNNATAGEEERGTLDLLLTTPTPRWRVIVEKAAAFIVASLLILTQASLGLMAAILITPELTIPMPVVFPAFLNVLPMMLLLGAFTLLLCTVLRSRQTALGFSAAFIVARIFGYAGLVSDSGFHETLSSSRRSTTSMGAGAPGRPAVACSWASRIIAAVLLSTSMYAFQRRYLIGGSHRGGCEASGVSHKKGRFANRPTKARQTAGLFLPWRGQRLRGLLSLASGLRLIRPPAGLCRCATRSRDRSSSGRRSGAPGRFCP